MLVEDPDKRATADALLKVRSFCCERNRIAVADLREASFPVNYCFSGRDEGYAEAYFQR
jgi:hypothetical protein